MKSKLLLLGFCILVFKPIQSYSWGFMGHKVIAEVSTEIMQNDNQFWPWQRDNVAYLANVPDWHWKALETHKEERPTHYYQPDFYVSSPNMFNKVPLDYDEASAIHSEEVVIYNGTALWRVQQLFEVARRAFLAGDVQYAVEVAGTMAHYVGDLSQPLHVTMDYDGQENGNKGIHKFFETTNLNNYDEDQLRARIRTRAESLYKSSKYKKMKKKSLEYVVFESIKRSFEDVKTINQIDLEHGRFGEGAKKQLDLAIERAADGAATLAVLYYKLSKVGGKNAQKPKSVEIELPDWIAPEYSRTQINRDDYQCGCHGSESHSHGHDHGHQH